MTQKLHLPIHGLELWRFASTDPYRENLTWVELKTIGNHHVVMTATDGAMLARVDWTTDEELEGEDQAVYLSAPDLKVALTRASKKERLAGGDLTSEGLELMGVPAAMPITFGSPSFPPVDDVIPGVDLPPLTKKDTARGVKLGLDLKYLGRIETWCKATKTDTQMAFTMFDPQEPARLDSFKADVAVTFVVMPCRI